MRTETVKLLVMFWVAAMPSLSFALPSSANGQVNGTAGGTPAGQSQAARPAPTNAVPNANSDRNWSATWSLQLGGQFSRDTLANQRTQSSMSLNLGLEYDFTEFFSLDVSPQVSFRNGHVQAATGSNGRENSMELNHAMAVLTDHDYIEANLGMIDLSEIHSSLLVAATFPGASLRLSSGDANSFAAHLIGLTAVPSSATLTNNSQDYYKTPGFQSIGVQARYSGDTVHLLLQGSQFQYSNLPLNVATDSVFLGNSGSGPDYSPQREFIYQYRGQEVRFDLGLRLTRDLSYQLKSSAIQNSEAPAGLNQGYLIANEINYQLTGKWMIAPNFSYFRVEPDATVANYNNDMTTTNRVGYATGMRFAFKRMFRVGANGGEREVIYEKTSQAREKFMNLYLETFDVPL